MYKWVQEPGVVARFMAGGRGKTHFSPFGLREEQRLLDVRGVYLGSECASSNRFSPHRPFALRRNRWNLLERLEAVISGFIFES